MSLLLLFAGSGGIPSGLDTAAKRAAAAHVKKPGKGVTPGTLSTTLGRFAVGWNYGGSYGPTPPSGTGIPDTLRLGECPVAPPTLGNMWG